VGAARLAAVGHPDANAAAAAEAAGGGGGGGDYSGDDAEAEEEELAPMAGDAADAEARAAEGEEAAGSTGVVARIAGRVRSWLSGKAGVAAGAQRAHRKPRRAGSPPSASQAADADAAPPPPGAAFETAEAAALRAAHTRATTKLAELKARAEELRAREAATDGGADGALLALVGNCYEAKVDAYTYHACPFAGARQEPGGVSLGTNSGGVEYAAAAEGDEAAAASASMSMLFQGGLACWNGPQRSLRLELRCGPATALTAVDEPSRCEYAGVLETPAACNQAEANFLQERAEQARRAAEAAFAAAHSEL